MLLNLPNSRVPGLCSSKVVILWAHLHVFYQKKVLCKPKIRLNSLSILFTCFRYRHFDEKL